MNEFFNPVVRYQLRGVWRDRAARSQIQIIVWRTLYDIAFVGLSNQVVRQSYPVVDLQVLVYFRLAKVESQYDYPLIQ
jgi:hypothetical protein